jgi:hypothetical protein
MIFEGFTALKIKTVCFWDCDPQETATYISIPVNTWSLNQVASMGRQHCTEFAEWKSFVSRELSYSILPW